MPKLIITTMLLFSFLSACATGERMQEIREGMAKEQVIEILGQPDGFQRRGEYEALRYTNRLISGWSWDRADYNVILRNDRVLEYGAGEVRQNDANTGTLILAPLN